MTGAGLAFGVGGGSWLCPEGSSKGLKGTREWIPLEGELGEAVGWGVGSEQGLGN